MATGRTRLDLEAGAVQLAEFLQALQRSDAHAGPPPGEHNGGRGEPLRARDAATRRTLPTLPAGYDIGRLLRIWDETLATPVRDAPPVWIHGDLLPGNLLVQGQRLSAVIDFGYLGVGDHAVDLLPAWALCTPATRPHFRAALGVDDATWQRGRGWALSWAVIALPYYVATNLVLAGIARHTLEQLLDK